MPQTVAIENIVAEHHCNVIVTDKFFADDECLCQSVGTFLNGIGKAYSELSAVAEKLLESGCVGWC